MIATLTITFVFDTSIGIAVGLGLSFVVFLAEFVTSQYYKPELVSYSTSNHGIAVVKVAGDLNFLTSARVKDFVSALTTREIPIPDESSSRSDYLFQKVSSTLDYYLIPEVKNSPFCKDLMPLAIVVDVEAVLIVDLSGLSVLGEICSEARDKNVKVVIMNERSHLVTSLTKFGIENDVTNRYVNLDEYVMNSLLPRRPMNELLPVNPSHIHVDSDEMLESRHSLS